jgi:hypothetical protein
MIRRSRMVLDSPGPLLTPIPSSSPPKTPIRSYSAITPPHNGNQTLTPQGCRCVSRRERGTGGQNGPQAHTEVMRHPSHITAAERQSADNTTANQTTTRAVFLSLVRGARERERQTDRQTDREREYDICAPGRLRTRMLFVKLLSPWSRSRTLQLWRQD